MCCLLGLHFSHWFGSSNKLEPGNDHHDRRQGQDKDQIGGGLKISLNRSLKPPSVLELGSEVYMGKMVIGPGQRDGYGKM